MPPRSGRFPDNHKKHPGWMWEIYQDPGSTATGWTMKIWNPRDDSNGGKPVEFFEKNYDYEKDMEASARQQAEQQAAAARGRAAEEQAVRDRNAIQSREDSAARQRDKELDRLYGDKDKDRTARRDETILNNTARMAELQLRLKQDKLESDRSYEIEGKKLGADLLKTAASLRGPDDLVQGWAYAQGVSDGGLSPYVNAVMGGGDTVYGGGQARGGNPAPVTLGSLAASMGGGGGGGGGAAQYGYDAYGRPKLAPQKQAFVEGVGRQVAAGVGNLPQGYFERMTKGQRKGYLSAVGYNGASPDDEMEYYERSRAGQGSAFAG